MQNVIRQITKPGKAFLLGKATLPSKLGRCTHDELKKKSHLLHSPMRP